MCFEWVNCRANYLGSMVHEKEVKSKFTICLLWNNNLAVNKL